MHAPVRITFRKLGQTWLCVAVPPCRCVFLLAAQDPAVMATAQLARCECLLRMPPDAQWLQLL